LNLKEAKVPDTSINEADIGNLLHEALHNVLKNMKVVNEDLLMIELRKYLLSENRGLLWNYHIDIWLDLLKKFASLEAQRYENGYRVHSLERSYSVNYKGFILDGKIDRVDIKDNKFTVIDYKSGRIPKSTIRTLDKEVDFQLEFYYHLTKKEKEIDGLYYYDLKKAELVKESLFEEKLEKLDEILEELKNPIVDFKKCEIKSSCEYCPFIKLCDINI